MFRCESFYKYRDILYENQRDTLIYYMRKFEIDNVMEILEKTITKDGKVGGLMKRARISGFCSDTCFITSAHVPVSTSEADLKNSINSSLFILPLFA